MIELWPAVHFGNLRIRVDPCFATLRALPLSRSDESASSIRITLARDESRPQWACGSGETVRLWPGAQWEGLKNSGPGITRDGLLLKRNFSAIRIDGTFSRLDCWASGDRPLRALEHALIGEILPRVSGQAGLPVLHAGSSLVGDRAVLFLGQSGAGKSTLVAAMARAGHAPIGDDSGFVHFQGNEPRFGPFSRTCRLLEDSANEFADPAGIDAARRDLAGKVAIHSHPSDVGWEAVPVAAIIDIRPTAGAEFAARRLDGYRALQSLIASLMVLTPSASEVIGRHMVVLSRIVERVPVFEVDIPRNFGALSEVCSEVEILVRACAV